MLCHVSVELYHFCGHTGGDMYENKPNPLLEKSEELADLGMEYARHILLTYREYYIADQLKRSALSIGEFIAEAQRISTDNAFLDKLRRALSECQELGYWLRRVHRADLSSPELHERTYDILTQVSRMLLASCRTVDTRLQHAKRSHTRTKGDNT